MNRLWVRLTLAFVAVTLVGVGIVAVLTDWGAGTEFRQYVARQSSLANGGLLDDLSQFFQQHGDWNGVAEVFGNYVSAGGRGQGLMRGRPLLALADAGGVVVYDERGTRVGTLFSADERAASTAVTAGGRTVGYLSLGSGQGRGPMSQAEQDFLDQLRRTLAIAALLAGGLGLVMSIVISYMLAQPLGHLALAARSFAGRDWSHRVQERGADEIREVAREFNTMAQTIQDADAQRRNLMADVAHELRTPLTVLQGNLRAMLDGVYPLEMREIGSLYDETRLLSRLVDDLRELALADAGQLPLHVQSVDLPECVGSVVASFAPVAEAQGVALQFDDTPGIRLNADPDRLSQIVRNLLANALRHTPGGGRIVVSVRQAAGAVEIDVADTGEGIPAQELPHVFDRFYRGDKSRARSSGSTGLGLAIAKAWIEAMGGSIGVTSEEGKGSRFRLTLPL